MPHAPLHGGMGPFSGRRGDPRRLTPCPVEGAGGLVGGEAQGGFAAVGRAHAPARLAQVAVDRVLGDVQLAGDLLGLQMTGDETQTLPLTRGQALDTKLVVS